MRTITTYNKDELIKNKGIIELILLSNILNIKNSIYCKTM